MENPIRIDDLGTIIFGNTHIWNFLPLHLCRVLTTRQIASKKEQKAAADEERMQLKQVQIFQLVCFKKAAQPARGSYIGDKRWSCYLPPEYPVARTSKIRKPPWEKISRPASTESLLVLDGFPWRMLKDAKTDVYISIYIYMWMDVYMYIQVFISLYIWCKHENGTAFWVGESHSAGNEMKCEVNVLQHFWRLQTKLELQVTFFAL